MKVYLGNRKRGYPYICVADKGNVYLLPNAKGRGYDMDWEGGLGELSLSILADYFGEVPTTVELREGYYTVPCPQCIVPSLPVLEEPDANCSVCYGGGLLEKQLYCKYFYEKFCDQVIKKLDAAELKLTESQILNWLGLQSQRL